MGWREIGWWLTKEVAPRERSGDFAEGARTRHVDEVLAVWLIEINPLLRSLLPCFYAARASNDATLVGLLGEARQVYLAWAELCDAVEVGNVAVRWLLKK